MNTQIMLDLQSRQPIYEQLKAKISELVLLGVLQPGDLLPTVRNLARDLGINPNTVQKAYQELERDNIIHSMVGRGTYISASDNLKDQLRERQIQRVKSAVLLAKNSSVTKKQITKAVDEVFDGENNGKGESQTND